MTCLNELNVCRKSKDKGAQIPEACAQQKRTQLLLCTHPRILQWVCFWLLARASGHLSYEIFLDVYLKQCCDNITFTPQDASFMHITRCSLAFLCFRSEVSPQWGHTELLISLLIQTVTMRHSFRSLKDVGVLGVSYLVCKHKDRLHGKTTRAEVEQVLQARSKQIHDQDIVVFLLTIPPGDISILSLVWLF